MYRAAVGERGVVVGPRGNRDVSSSDIIHSEGIDDWMEEEKHAKVWYSQHMCGGGSPGGGGVGGDVPTR